MQKEGRTEEFLNEVYKNANMGSESISFVTKKTEDPQLLSDLQCQHKEFTDILNSTVDALAKEQKLPKTQNPAAQLGIWSGVQMNTMLDRSPDKIAEMMIQGSMMGVIDMTRTLKEYSDTPQSVRKLGEDLITLEENSIQRMKQYLG